MDEAELIRKLREAFAEEAEERLTSLSVRLMNLEKGIGGMDAAQDLEVAFREAHSLKGAARSVNLREVETLCQAMEGVFAAMKRRELQGTPDIFDLLHRSVKSIEAFLAVPDADRPPRPGEEMALLQSQLKEVSMGKVSNIPRGPSRDQEPPADGDIPPPISVPESDKPTAQAPPPDQGGRSVRATIRISTSKLDALFLKVEELLSLKLASAQHLVDLKAILRSMEGWDRKWGGIEGERRALRRMADPGSPMKPIEQFLEWNREFVRSVSDGIASLIKDCQQKGRVLDLMVDDLLDEMKRVTMLPFSTLLDIFPRMVREVAREMGKEVAFIVKGGQVEIDRRILEEIKDPLTHLLRNAVDHGIESPDERVEKKKPAIGTIQLRVSQKEPAKIEVLVSDDGRGIDLDQVKTKALALGMISKEEMETLTEEAALSLVCRSGLSTSPIITDLSGRGLGMAIVQEKVEKLGGRLSLQTALGAGTSVRMELPVAIAAFRGVEIRVGGVTFLIPSLGLERALRVRQDDIKSVENRATVSIDGKAVALADLAAILGTGNHSPSLKGNGHMTVAVVGAGERRIGFRVDQILGEHEVVVKGLGSQLRHVPFISGAAVLGSGKVVPVLNVTELLNAPLETTVRPAALEEAGGEARRRSILVAEDSITSRMLLKSILEGAGYEVQTAVDGAEALATLRTGRFDLVVSDIEMPRMDGFELTRRIRSDKRYAEVPVVLVTGLETREDREKGIDAGANAYIVKSRFDQSNLLEVIRRLM